MTEHMRRNVLINTGERGILLDHSSGHSDRIKVFQTDLQKNDHSFLFLWKKCFCIHLKFLARYRFQSAVYVLLEPFP